MTVPGERRAVSDPGDFSVYALAPEAAMSAPSIDYFFRSPTLVLMAMAERYLAAFRQILILPASPGLLDHSVEMTVINEAGWSLSCHRHGRITDEMNERARLARVSCALTFLPERPQLRATHAPGRDR